MSVTVTDDSVKLIDFDRWAKQSPSDCDVRYTMVLFCKTVQQIPPTSHRNKKMDDLVSYYCFCESCYDKLNNGKVVGTLFNPGSVTEELIKLLLNVIDLCHEYNMVDLSQQFDHICQHYVNHDLQHRESILD